MFFQKEDWQLTKYTMLSKNMLFWRVHNHQLVELDSICY